MYLIGWLCVLTLEKWPLVAHRSPLVTRAVCCSEPYVGCLCLSVVVADHCGKSGRYCRALVQLALVLGLVLCGGCWNHCGAGPQGGWLQGLQVPGTVLAHGRLGGEQFQVGCSGASVSGSCVSCWGTGLG